MVRPAAPGGGPRAGRAGGTRRPAPRPAGGPGRDAAGASASASPGTQRPHHRRQPGHQPHQCRDGAGAGLLPDGADLRAHGGDLHALLAGDLGRSHAAPQRGQHPRLGRRQLVVAREALQRKVFAHARTPQQQRRHAGLHRYQRGQLTIVALAQGQQPAQAALRRVVQCVLQMRHRARVAGAQPVVRELQALPGAQRVPRAVVQVHHLAVVGEQDDAEIHLVQRPRQQGAR